MKTYAIHTLGCKVNSYESDAIGRLFEIDGYHKVSFKEVADVYIINTCTVTNTGDSKSRQMIRRANRKNPDAVICVVGCYSQVAPDEIKEIEGVDIVLGTQFRNEIVDLCNEHLKTKKQVVKIADVMKEKVFEELGADFYTDHTRAYLKIQDGCNNFCTYCIIPYARGLVRSRKEEDVLNQARKLVEHGFVEIVLTGIHTGAYGLDLDISFYDLLVSLTTKVEGLKRLRISSIEINQITDKIIELIGSGNIVVDHLHIPLQAGSQGVLKRMNRKYTKEMYKEKIDHIRSYLPDIAITTDIIAGFPQESDEEFNEMVDFIKEIQFSELHVFPYSRRRGTPAAKMSGQVDEKVKNERVKVLLDLSKQLHYEYACKFIDKEVQVIFEEEVLPGMLTGHSSNYLKINALGNKELIGNIVKVKVNKVNMNSIEGIIIHE